MNKRYTMIRKCLLTLSCVLFLFVAQAQEKSGSGPDSTATTGSSVTQQSTETAADSTITAGAPQQHVEMADVMRSEGKIYVVVGIILIVLAIMLIYLFSIDRNVKRLEKQLAEKGK